MLIKSRDIQAILACPFFCLCFSLADANQALCPPLFCFISKFKIPQPSGLYLQPTPPPPPSPSPPPPLSCIAWYRCGLFIKLKQQEIPQIIRGPAFRKGERIDSKEDQHERDQKYDFWLYMVTKLSAAESEVFLKRAEKECAPLLTERWDLESQKRKDKRRTRSTFGLFSHPLFSSQETHPVAARPQWPICLLHRRTREKEEFNKRPLGSRQKDTQQWRLTGSL